MENKYEVKLSGIMIESITKINDDNNYEKVYDIYNNKDDSKKFLNSYFQKVFNKLKRDEDKNNER